MRSLRYYGTQLFPKVISSAFLGNPWVENVLVMVIYFNFSSPLFFAYSLMVYPRIDYAASVKEHLYFLHIIFMAGISMSSETLTTRDLSSPGDLLTTLFSNGRKSS